MARTKVMALPRPNRVVFAVLISLLGLCLVFVLGNFLRANAQAATVPQAKVASSQAQNAQTKGQANDCQVFANTNPPTGAELNKGDTLIVSYVTLTSTNCTAAAMVVDFNSSGTLTGVSDPGTTCFSLDETDTRALCTVQNGQVLTASIVVSVTGNVAVDIYSLGVPAEPHWQGFWRKILGSYLPLITR